MCKHQNTKQDFEKEVGAGGGKAYIPAMERTQQLLEEIGGEPLTGSGFEGEPFVTEDGTTVALRLNMRQSTESVQSLAHCT